ncbi:HVA22-like protein k [Prosopis cineraria]|uniref:HVA22-like protein k n=1 Tax=Prosopis cineraria TaxID=364024 RepID=UPI0024100005|nr:HVA22-like protein k [Prosopis cineraria]
MALPGEVGLQLLLSPLGSKIVVRTACCSAGLVLPVYCTFKAIENKDQNEQQRWLTYWAAYGSFSVVEMFAEKVLSWIPLYYHMKFAFLVWLQLPTVNGARQLYESNLRPFLLKHRARMDQIVEFIYGEMGKFISAHQAEFLIARSLLTKVVVTANEMIRSAIRPVERQESQGPRRESENSEPENE